MSNEQLMNDHVCRVPTIDWIPISDRINFMGIFVSRQEKIWLIPIEQQDEELEKINYLVPTSTLKVPDMFNENKMVSLGTEEIDMKSMTLNKFSTFHLDTCLFSPKEITTRICQWKNL